MKLKKGDLVVSRLFLTLGVVTEAKMVVGNNTRYYSVVVYWQKKGKKWNVHPRNLLKVEKGKEWELVGIGGEGDLLKERVMFVALQG